MENLCDELDKSKAEISKVREECMEKTKMYDSLRTAHARQIAEVGEARLKIERQAYELSVKSEEISEVRGMYEELKADMERKDLLLRSISAAQEKLRLDFGEKMLKLEGENREMVGALNEATSRIQDLENQVDAANVEISGLKRVLSVKQEKCSKDVEAVRVLKERDDVIVKLEEEKRDAQEQLKWKTEQFKHLEEAHGKVHDNFKRSMMESEKEKSAMIEEITSLQASLDSQTRISESFQAQLKICHQSLAHEESKRKVLEIELSEFRSRYEDVFSECRDAKYKMELMTLKRDEEIGELRNLFRTKESLCKEMEYKATNLEQENKELLLLLKELQEAQLSRPAPTSLKKLKKELAGLQLLHGKCSIDLKEKESNWSSRMEMLKGELRCSLSELKEKDGRIKELQKELDSFQESFEVGTEEISMLVTVFKSELNLVYSKQMMFEKELERSENQKILEMEDESKIIDHLETEARDLRQKLESQRVAFLHSEEELIHLNASLKASNSEMEDQKNMFENEKLHMHGVIKDLNSQNKSYQEYITRLSDARDDLLAQMERTSEHLDVLCGKDAKLSESLRRMTPYSEVETGLFDATCGIVISPFSPSRKLTEANTDERHPLTELNRDAMKKTAVEGKSP